MQEEGGQGYYIEVSGIWENKSVAVVGMSQEENV
jgi:hypothetical protein